MCMLINPQIGAFGGGGVYELGNPQPMGPSSLYQFLTEGVTWIRYVVIKPDLTRSYHFILYCYRV